MFKDIIFGKQKDVKGNTFRRYSSEYAERKSSGKLKNQASDSRNSRAPYVTGDFKNDFRFRSASNNGFRLGWASYGGRVNRLAKMGRPVTTDDDVFPEPVKDMINSSLKSEIKLALKKTHKTKTITIGK